MSAAPPVPSLADCVRGLADGSLSAVALTETALARIAALDPTLHAFIAVVADRARAAAARADAEIAAGRRRGPFHGVPYALKDIVDVAGLPTTAHSKLRLGHVAEADAAIAARLEAEGMILVGKLSLHEFARGGPTDVLPWPNARNPWNTDHACGGSSSGAGVAVAAGMVPFAVGTDTGGSVRVPAAFTGIVGLKPTYGLVSRRGVVPLSFELDHVGPLARTVEDCALALGAMAGFDPADPGSVDAPEVDLLAGIGRPIAGLRIGVARAYDADYGVGAEQQAARVATERVLADLGASVVAVDMPPRPKLDAATWTILLAEGFAIHHADLGARPQDYGRTARERLSIGAFVTGGDLVQARRWRRLLTQAMERSLDGVDAILCSTALGPPSLVAEVDDRPWRKTQPITGPFNLTGHPALAVPAGFCAGGLPLSVQFVGRHFDEAGLFRIAHACEQATGWHERRPC